MDDARSHMVGRYAALSADGQSAFLTKLAHRLTIDARDTYDRQGGVTDSARLRRFNEAEHHILGQLLRLSMGDQHRYPNDVFSNMLVDHLEALKIAPEGVLQWS
jgi:hypothetical protein